LVKNQRLIVARPGVRPCLFEEANGSRKTNGPRDVRSACLKLPSPGSAGSRQRPTRVRHQLRRRQLGEAEVERLAAAHRQTGERAMLASGLDRILRFDERDQIGEQFALERRVGLELDRHARPATAAESGVSG
jgi:hypothetical protein